MAEITVEQLDQKVREMYALRSDYEQVSKIQKEAYALYTKADNELVAMLQQLGKSSYKVDGLGTFSVVSRQRVQTPKTVEEKMALMDFILGKYGRDVMLDKFSINHNTLNSFYKAEYDATPDELKAGFQVPGLGMPVEDIYSKWLSERPKKV